MYGYFDGCRCSQCWPAEPHANLALRHQCMCVCMCVCVMGEQDMAWILEQRNLDAVSKAPPYPLRNGLYLAPMQTAL